MLPKLLKSLKGIAPKTKTVPPTKTERLAMYRKAEDALKELFSASNYCLENCISQKVSKYPTWQSIPGRIGCCDKNYFEMFFDLPENSPTIKELKRLQKRNSTSHRSRTGECDYHSETGCQVKCYNTPVCLGYICRQYIQHLENNYQVRYPPETLVNLEKILEGKKSEEETKKWLARVQEATERVKKGKKNQDANQGVIEL